jgi:hypothetical protein
MSKLKLLTIGVVLLVLLVVVGAVFAGTLASFDNPRVANCNLDTLKISGTLRIGDTVYVEEYINGELNTRFTGRAGAYSGYVSYFGMSNYPYSWDFQLSFKDSSGATIEQYALEGTCTAEDVGQVTFTEVELDAEDTGLNLS